MQPQHINSLLAERAAFLDEQSFHATMASILSDACEIADDELDHLHHQFTHIMCGILFVLCGLALTAVLAW